MGYARPVTTERPSEAMASGVVSALPLPELERDIAAGAFEEVHAFVALYRDGRWLGRQWQRGPSVPHALGGALDGALKASADLRPTAAVVVFPYDHKPLNQKTKERVLSDVHRGVHGAGIWDGPQTHLVSPTECIARNQPLATLLDRLTEDLGQDLGQLMADGRIFSFRARQFFVKLEPDPVATELLRGNQLVELSAVTRERIREFERDMSRWMLGALQRDGRMTYMYLPSRSAEVSDNNMIRQSMATACLGRIARRAEELELEGTAQDAADLNLRYHLRTFYRREGELGFIEHNSNAYLGSAALTLIAILESPRRQELHSEEQGLRRTLDALWQTDGAFRTWIKPASRNDNQNFFPGEALLAWSLLYREEKDSGLLERFLKSYEYYRKWHLSYRNPAFVPWHTQAYCQLLEVEEPAGLLPRAHVEDRLVVESSMEILRRPPDVGDDDPLGPAADLVGEPLGEILPALQELDRVGLRAGAHQDDEREGDRSPDPSAAVGREPACEVRRRRHR